MDQQVIAARIVAIAIESQAAVGLGAAAELRGEHAIAKPLRGLDVGRSPREARPVAPEIELPEPVIQGRPGQGTLVWGVEFGFVHLVLGFDAADSGWVPEPSPPGSPAMMLFSSITRSSSLSEA